MNDRPVARDDYAEADPDTPFTFSATQNDLDVDGDTLTLAAVDTPAHGTAEIVDGQLRYTPSAGFLGIDVFGYTVIDGHGGSARAAVHLGVGSFPPGEPSETIAISGGPFSTFLPRAAAISSDGRLIAFTSSLPLVSSDTNNVDDVYLYDRNTRALARVSVASDGAQANGASQNPSLSADGRYIAFESDASNLVAGDSNGQDVFRHDRVTGETVRISVSTAGSQGNGASFAATISDDGNLVAFTSTSFNLVADDANGASDIFVRDVAAGTTKRVSVSFTGADADLGSSEPAISGDGRFVAFTSSATNLVAEDTNNLNDIFVRDLVAGATQRVSVSTTGGQADGSSSGPSVSQDGRFISFRSTASNLVSGASGGPLLFVRDIQSPTTTWPNSLGPVIWARLSGDGRYVTEFVTSASISSVSDRFAGFNFNSTLGSGLWPVLSRNGRYIVVLNSASGGSVTVLSNSL